VTEARSEGKGGGGERNENDGKKRFLVVVVVVVTAATPRSTASLNTAVSSTEFTTVKSRIAAQSLLPGRLAAALSETARK